jgi:diguanylate cyclase (GGDEF)-like protein/PAS domain S-box-containing protein
MGDTCPPDQIAMDDVSRPTPPTGPAVTTAEDREAREQSALIQAVYASAPVGLSFVDTSLRCKAINARMAELTGHSIEASLGRRPTQIYGDQTVAQRSEQILQRVIDTGVPIEGIEYNAVTKNSGGTERNFLVSYQPVRDTDGTVLGVSVAVNDVTEHKREEARFSHLARHDPLTNLPNRVLFHETLEHALTYARRGQLLALYCLDLDHFKVVNDTLGHPIGDQLLQAVAQRLREGVRETDTPARLGGDEFAIIQGNLAGPRDAVALARRLIAMVEAPFEIAGHQIVVGTSIGIVFAPADGTDADTLMKNADLALYRAKFDGRGVYRLFHTAMDTEVQARRRLELDLRQALRRSQFELHYQPLIDLQSQAVCGFEALLRWRHPDRGMVLPEAFIPLAEEVGIIGPIGEWALSEASRAAASWPGELRVSVNLSPAQFKSGDLVGVVRAALHASGLAPDRLELEITETVMLRDVAATLATLHDLRSIGVRTTMDDFGNGNSSLSYLRRFPFDRIKLDPSFIRDLGQHRESTAIVRALIGLSGELGMAATAEGVETLEQLRILAQVGCTDIQGYLFSRPVPASEIPALLRSMPTPARLLEQPESCDEVVAAAGD